MPDNLESIRRRVPFLDHIKGFLAPEEGEALYRAGYACASPGGPCLEIGGYCGLSTVYLGLGVRDAGGILFSIDHHCGSEEHQPGEGFHDPDLYDPETGRMDSFREFQSTVGRAGLRDTVVPIVANSSTAARMWATPLSLVLIDGGHSPEAAWSDYRGFAPHILSGGILAIHDVFLDPGEGGQAPREIRDAALASGLFRSKSLITSLALLRRIHP
ncbi:MAG: class I SAM-dependent methyltransferase [Desulfohalobiaceae bacterium]|nr:class I SAM-dependent methyltransferase [Desulfohalobiaceae bacterium]